MPKKPPKRTTAKRSLDTARIKPRKTPLWKGPIKDGITQSIIQAYIACKERLRLRAIDGLQVGGGFGGATGFGNMWHKCDEEYSAGRSWEKALLKDVKKMVAEHRTQSHEINDWYNVTKVMFPIYLEFWGNQKEMKTRKNLYSEERFCVPYRVSAGREAVDVLLRGMWDSADYSGPQKRRSLSLQENKTKGQINLGQIQQQLEMDLQTMTYVTALSTDQQRKVDKIRYNVIRRPRITQKRRDDWNVLREAVDKEPDNHFFRWDARLNSGDISRFEEMVLQPLLGNICDDYEWWVYCQKKGVSPFDQDTRSHHFPWHRCRHYLMPYGCYSVVAQGGVHSLDPYIMKGSTVGLTRVQSMFPELED